MTGLREESWTTAEVESILDIDKQIRLIVRASTFDRREESGTLAIDKRQQVLTAILGDLLHKVDIYVQTGTYGIQIDQGFLSNEAQAYWLLTYRKDLVPPKEPNGTLPSVHRIATAFESHYYSDVSLRVQYAAWLRKGLK